jgi:hypothetical protein
LMGAVSIVTAFKAGVRGLLVSGLFRLRWPAMAKREEATRIRRAP